MRWARMAWEILVCSCKAGLPFSGLPASEGIGVKALDTAAAMEKTGILANRLTSVALSGCVEKSRHG